MFSSNKLIFSNYLQSVPSKKTNLIDPEARSKSSDQMTTLMILHPCSDPEQLEAPESPHEALYLVLPYLPVSDLLSVAQVCTSFREAVHNDVLIWLDILVHKPLNMRLSDEILLHKLASRANGRIRCLALIDCIRITDQGLQRVVETNPLIEKLYIPGCNALTPEGVLAAVRTLTSTSSHHHKLRALKISGIPNMTKDHLESLCSYIPAHLLKKLEEQNIHHIYFHHRNRTTYLYEEATWPIDVDLCPRCKEIKTVYDCPRETCRDEQQQIRTCRGCRYCIVRCEECGGCVVHDDEMGEAACEDTLCLKCWLMLPKCNFCNKAYCKEHAHLDSSNSSGSTSTGFVCSLCLSLEGCLQEE